MWNYDGINMEQNNGILMEFKPRIYSVKYRQYGILTFPLYGNLMEFFKTAFHHMELDNSITWNWIIPLHGIG